MSVAADLRVRGATEIVALSIDATDLNSFEEQFKSSVRVLGGLDTVLVAHGVLPDQNACEKDAQIALNTFQINTTSTISLLTIIANYFEREKKGCITVLSSVAGDRGRKNNYVYGASKAAVSTYLQGLRARLSATGVSVVTVKLGFVLTPMTAHLSKSLLSADADTVGRRIYQVMKRPRSVVYIPGYWRWIMAVIRSVPESIFKRINL